LLYLQGKRKTDIITVRRKKTTLLTVIDFAGGSIMDYSTTYRLAQEIRDSEEYKSYHDLKETVMAEETTAALIREYRKLQMTIQMSAMSGNAANQEDVQRFSGISTLLFSKPEVSQFLLSEMRLQQMLADIFKILTEAADVDMAVPGTEG
jgi:cell fate (sporulation/competence/biofilm development) regulator YlbF (YheA/YmcA/DUF963 family)